MRYMQFLAIAICLMFTTGASANCPETTSGPLSVQGKYLGWFEAEEGTNQVCVAVNDNVEFCVASSEAEADNVFGNNKGAMVQLDYRNEQFEYEGQCTAIAVLTGGKVLSATSKAAVAKNEIPLAVGDTFFLCTNKGNTPETKCMDKGDYIVDPNAFVEITAGDRTAVLSFMHKGKVVHENFVYERFANNSFNVSTDKDTTVFKLTTKNGRTYFASDMYTFVKLNREAMAQLVSSAPSKAQTSNNDPIRAYINKNSKLVFSPCAGKGKGVEKICSRMDNSAAYTFEKGGDGYVTHGTRMDMFNWQTGGDQLTTVNENGVKETYKLVDGKYFVNSDMELFVIRN